MWFSVTICFPYFPGVDSSDSDSSDFEIAPHQNYWLSSSSDEDMGNDDDEDDEET